MPFLRFAAKFAVKNAAFAVAGITALGGGATARAQDISDDSELRGHRLRLGLGASLGTEHLGSLFHSNVVYDTPYGDIDYLGADAPNFVGLKADYTFFRPARQEGLVSLYALAPFSSGHGVGASVNVVDNYTSGQAVLVLVPEYRLRFFGQGIGYAGIGVGAANRGFVLNSVSAVATGAVGVDVAGFYVEARSLYFQRDDAAFTTVFVGHRL